MKIQSLYCEPGIVLEIPVDSSMGAASTSPTLARPQPGLRQGASQNLIGGLLTLFKS